MGGEVGSAQVAVVPTFKGFRRGVTAEVDASTKESASRFSRGFSSAGTTAGKGFSDGFKSASKTLTAPGLKAAQADVAKASREVSAARLKEQDAAGKVRVAETQLAADRRRYASDSVQVVRAEERLATAQRGLVDQQSKVERSTESLTSAKKGLASASNAAADQVARSGGRMTGFFSNLGGESAQRFKSTLTTGVGAIFSGNLLADLAFAGGRKIGQGIQLGVSFAFDGIGLASDLNESINATNVSFGTEISAQLQKLGQDAPQRLGLTRRSFAQFATQFSAFAKTIRRDNPTEFIDQLTNRGADFASVFNLEVADALQLFQSGLAGETEPLRRYGLDLSAATVEAYAYASGIGTVGEELTEQEKVQARWGALLEQTAVVQGDNANTAGELAGQQRRLAAGMEEAQTRLGQFFLPAFQGFVSYANSDILPVFGNIVDKVGPILAGALETASPKMQELLDKAGPLAEKFATMAAEDGIPAVVDGLNSLADEAPKVADFFQRANDPESAAGLNAINESLQDMGETYREAVEDVFGVEEPWMIYAETARNIGEAWDGLWGGIRDSFAENEGWFRESGESAGENFSSPFIEGVDRGVNVGKGSLGFFSEDIKSKGAEWGASGRAGGEQIGLGIFGGMDAKRGDVSASGTRLGDSALSGAMSSKEKLRQLGLDTGEGFARGIDDKNERVRIAATGLAATAERAVQGRLVIASPSRRLREDGRWTGEGFALGMEDKYARVDAAAARMVDIGRPGAVLMSRSTDADGVESGGAGAAASTAFPSQVTLVDRDGSLLGLMDVRVNGYDRAQQDAGARGRRRDR